MTYRMLKEILNSLPENVLSDDVTLIDYSTDEVLEVNGHMVIDPENEWSDVLDPGHLVLTFNS